MRKITILLIASLLALLAACDMETADSSLHGKWTAFGGLSLEFTTGRYTKTLPGEVQKGTYKTDGDYIHFFRTGESAEKFLYTLSHPTLIVDGVTYYYDAPKTPHDLAEVWYGFWGENATTDWHNMKINKAKPLREDPLVYEGKFEIFYLLRGDYTISRRNIPDSGNFVMVTTHMHGRWLRYFIELAMPAYLQGYFDIAALQVPEYSDDWWYSTAEAKKFYIDAAQKAAGNYFHVDAIMNRMRRNMNYLGMGDVDVYDYKIEVVNKPFWDFWGFEYGAEGVETKILTLRSPDYGYVATLHTGEFFTHPDYGRFGFSNESSTTMTFTLNTSCDCELPAYARACFHTEGF